MPSLLGFDPVEFAEEILVGIAIIILLSLAYKYRTNLMLFFTGDDQFHLSCLECFWSLMTCGGFCSGEWTRYLTRCPCVPPRNRGVNLYRKTGQLMGLTTTPIEIKNIVVGDLPYRGRADFYLGVECAANPTMYTSVSEKADPKIVHFPEIFTLRIRNSPLEQPVRIVVRAIHVVGSEDIASCYIDPQSILDWADDDDEERVKRLELKPCNSSNNPITPAWVLLEFDQPSDMRNLNHFYGGRTTVRTSMAGTGTTNDWRVADFKTHYKLVNPAGGPAFEIPEDELYSLQRYDRVFFWIGWFLTLLVTLTVLVYVVVRSYLWTCWSQMADLTLAHLHHRSFPINVHNLTQLEEHCAREIHGIDAAPGTNPCLPSDQQVLDFCTPQEEGGLFPQDAQPRPHAFERIINRHTGYTVDFIPCEWHTCIWRSHVARWDITLLCCVLAGPIFLFGFKTFSRRCIKHEKKRIKNVMQMKLGGGTPDRRGSPSAFQAGSSAVGAQRPYAYSSTRGRQDGYSPAGQVNYSYA